MHGENSLDGPGGSNRLSVPKGGSQEARLDCLDGLRGLAALWVVAGHCAILSGWPVPVLDKPDLGVDLFMMLSGYLMVFQYHLRARNQSWSTPGSWTMFWARRYFRIAPLYYVMLALCLFGGTAIMAWRGVSDSFVHVPLQANTSYTDHSLANILAHVTFVFGLLPHYAQRTPLPDWSLGLEMQFYAVFPAIMLLTRKWGWAISVTALALAALFVTRLTWHFSIHYPAPTLLALKIDIFLAGMLLAESWRQERRVALFYFLLALVLGAQPFQGEGSMLRTLVREILVVMFFALVLHRFLPKPLSAWAGGLAGRLGENPFRWMGDVSYSVYLLHLPILAPVAAFLASHYGHRISAPLRFAILFFAVSALVYPLSWLAYRLIEIPGQNIGRRWLRRISKRPADALPDGVESLAAP